MGIKKLLLGSLIVCLSTTAFAQSARNPWEEYSRLITSKATVGEMNESPFNEKVDLYNGSLSFRYVDIDLAGNSSLPVTLARTYSAYDRVNSGGDGRHFPFADWELDVPRISGVFGHAFRTWPYTTVQQYQWPDQRCSGTRFPPKIGPFHSVDYWYGVHAEMPHGGELLEPAAGLASPTSGGPYRWITADFTWFSCLPNIKNGTGEGFLAIARDGTKYWFDWLGKYEESQLTNDDTGPTDTLERRRNVLFATRVEDRAGNWVVYNYSGEGAAGARLLSIESNDGRRIDLAYDTQGFITSASAGSRTWQYGYGTVGLLSSVTLPDSSQWTFDLGSLTSYSPSYLEARCEHPGYWPAGELQPVYVGVITHPSGARAEFELRQLLHGRSHVPKNCLRGTEYSDFVRMYWVASLVKKRISGPGIGTLQWTYSYSDVRKPTDSFEFPNLAPPGSWATAPTLPPTIPPVSHRPAASRFPRR
jgi:YD repeat-containing protein